MPHHDLRAQSCVKVPGGRPGLPVPNKPDGSCGRKVARNSNSLYRGPVEMVVLGSPSLISLVVSVDVK